MSFIVFRRPYRFFLIAAVLALVLCLLPMRVDEAQDAAPTADVPQQQTNEQGVPAGADLSERTESGCMLHRTLYYTPCGHSVQRRETLDARLVGLTREALEAEISDVLGETAVTGFSSKEVDASFSLSIPCPLHWVLKGGEDGMLHVLQNRTGESLSLVRSTDVPLERAGEGERQELLEGRIFDDVQALEGYLESMSS